MPLRLSSFASSRFAWSSVAAAGLLAGVFGPTLFAARASSPHQNGLSASASAAAAPPAGASALAAPGVPNGAVGAISWTDTSGKVSGAEALAGAKATVFVFTSPLCPVSRQYGGRIVQAGKTWQKQGVQFVWVSAASRIQDDKTATKDARARGITFPVVTRGAAALADRLGANITPEAVVVDSEGAVRYIGRIDDNADSSKVTRRDLDMALTSVVGGLPVKYPRTRAFGCAIWRDDAVADIPASTSSAKLTKVTYARDVAPILQANCVSCHRTGDVAPFSLETYQDAKPWAHAIADYTKRGLMPPWKATANCGPFWDARILSPAQKQTLADWANNGTPSGDLKSIPVVKAAYAPGDWELGTPDVVTSPARPFHLEAEGRDVYRDFTIPIDFNEDRYISALDFKPTNRTIVHHIIAYIDLTGDTCRDRDNKETEPGWSVGGGGSGVRDSDWGEGWAPGMSPRRLSDGVAIKVPKGAKLVLQVHYHKSGKPEIDQSRMGIYWAKGPVTHVLHTAAVGNPVFALLPNKTDQEVKAAFIIPFDATLWAVLPHMHMLGKDMTVTATFPDKTQKTLIEVKNWEFNWQMAYRYKEPVKIPKGTRISLVARYDNTTANPNQPSNPPKLVTFGEQTTDEMCFAFMGFTRDGDYAKKTVQGASSSFAAKNAK